MALIATLVVSVNGATTFGGGSAALSTEPDRRRFLTLHRSAGAIITGKQSASIEDYSKTKVPIFVFTRNPARLHFTHPTMEQITVDRNLAEIARSIDERIDGDIVIEGGRQLILAMAKEGAIDRLYLTISPAEGDGDFIDLKVLLENFTVTSEIEEGGTRLLECRYQGNSTNC